MAEERNNIYTRLKNGEKIKCPVCHKGVLTPYNTTFDKAHSFNCSDEKCNGSYNFDVQINIE